jgi:GDP-D-mannose 3',5'-epimerase
VDKNKKVVIAGAGGFIGGWLVSGLNAMGFTNIVAVDIKPLKNWYQLNNDNFNLVLDLSNPENCQEVTSQASYVFNLAADMGGMGFIERNKALCMLSVLINTNLLKYSSLGTVEKYFFASSACVYNSKLQEFTTAIPLKEEDAYPALPEDGYGWEKLFSERMCLNTSEDFGIETRIARFHNVYGPLGTYSGGREKAPAAICRKVAEAVISGIYEIEIWGDGEQSRSFMYIDDCVDGILKIFNSSIKVPINLGSSQLVSINQLVSIVEKIAGVELERKYKLDAPLGVKGRNSDNSMIKSTLKWEPELSLEYGLTKTYNWIFNEMINKGC